MSVFHYPCGDGESDDGSGVLGMAWVVKYAGNDVATPAPSLYIENPHNDTDTTAAPVYRSDTCDETGVTYPSVSTVVGTTVTFAANFLPITKVGNALIDSAGDVFYVATRTSDTVCTVDRTGMATGTLAGLYLKTPRNITYSAQADGMPMVEKFYRNAWANFQLLRGGRTMDVTTRRFGQPASDRITQTVSYDANLATYLYDDLEYMRRVDVPTNQTRAIGLQVTITLGDPVSYWQLGAMVYEMEPKSTRTAAFRG